MSMRDVALTAILVTLLALPVLGQDECTQDGASNICVPRLLSAPGVNGGDGPGLDPSLTDCSPERTAANMRAHLDDVVSDLERAARYYDTLATNLDTIRLGLDQWCGNCRGAVQEFTSKGYSSCGGRLSTIPTPAGVAADPGFGPDVCRESVTTLCAPDDSRSAWCTTDSVPDPLAESCPLCLTLDCVYGHECRLGAPNAAARSATGATSCPQEPDAASAAACGGLDTGRVFPQPDDDGDGFGLDIGICIDVSILVDISVCASIGEGGIDVDADIGISGDVGVAVEGEVGVGAGVGVEAGAGIEVGDEVDVDADIGIVADEDEGGIVDVDIDLDIPPFDTGVPPDQCLTLDDRTSCNAGGELDVFDAPVGTIGSGADDLGIEGCVTEGSPRTCEPPAEGEGVPVPEEEPAQEPEVVDCTQCVYKRVWKMDPVDEDGTDCMACATWCDENSQMAGIVEGEIVADCLVCRNSCQWMSDLELVAIDGVTDCSTCDEEEVNGVIWSSPIRTVGDAWTVDCPACEVWCGDGTIFTTTDQGWVLDCIACENMCQEEEPVEIVQEEGTPMRMNAEPGTCTERQCCGPPFTCKDGYIDYTWMVTGCLPEEHECSQVTQTSLVTRRKRNVIPSPGGMHECQQNSADLKDVCTVEGSAVLGEGTLDPCTTANRLTGLVVDVRLLVTRIDETTVLLRRLAERLRIEHAQGFADRSNATTEAIVRELAVLLSEVPTSEGFQSELVGFVRLLQSEAFVRDISIAEWQTGTGYDIRAVTGGGPGDGLWDEYCSGHRLCGDCGGTSGPAGCLGPTSQGSYEAYRGDYRGRCASTGEVAAVVEERGLDTWRERGAVDNLGVIDVYEDLFIDTESCYRYDVQATLAGIGSNPLECTEVCRVCAGVDRSHCQPHLGVCVCEVGSWWLLTSQHCRPAVPAGGREMACCEQAFSMGAEPVHFPRRSGCAGPLVTGVTVDWCRRWPGLCCMYQFEEMPLERACQALGAGGACTELCRDLFKNERADLCAARCDDIVPACDEACLESGERICLDDCSPLAAPCIEACIKDHPENGTACEAACSAGAPVGTVRAFVTRDGAPVAPNQVFSKGDKVDIGGVLNNTGSIAICGTARLKLIILDQCACTEEGCVCREEVLLLLERPVCLAPGQGLDLGRISYVLERDNVSVQAFIEVVDERGEVTLTGRGPISHVVPAGTIVVRDAYFLGPRGRTTETYPGTTVNGAVVIEPAVVPVAVAVSLEKAGKPVANGAAFYKLTRRAASRPLTTGPLTAEEDDIDSVVSIHVKVIGSNGTVLLDRTLQQQGIVPGTCGTEMTARCLEQLGTRPPSYPSAFVQVRRLVLTVMRAVFMDADGRVQDTVVDNEDVTAAVWIKNPLATPFSGRIETTIVSKEQGTVTSKEETAIGSRALDPGEEQLVRTETVRVVAPDTYVLRAFARDGSDRVWLDEVVDTQLQALPAPTAPVLPPDPSAIAAFASIDTTIGIGQCRFTVLCTGCPSDCQLRIDMEQCTLTPRDCDCYCRSTAERTKDGMSSA